MSFVAAVEDAERAQLIADLKATKARVQKGWHRQATPEGDNKCVLFCAAEVINGQGARYTALAKALFAQLPQEFKTGPAYLGGEPAMLVGRYNDDSSTVRPDIENLIDKTLSDLGGLA